jgi:hypothetical protein
MTRNKVSAPIASIPNAFADCSRLEDLTLKEICNRTMNWHFTTGFSDEHLYWLAEQVLNILEQGRSELGPDRLEQYGIDNYYVNDDEWRHVTNNARLLVLLDKEDFPPSRELEKDPKVRRIERVYGILILIEAFRGNKQGTIDAEAVLRQRPEKGRKATAEVCCASQQDRQCHAIARRR